MTDPRFIDPLLVSEITMDHEEPEQFVLHRVPTHYRIRYWNKSWHRVYSHGFGKAYIVFAGAEWLIDDFTMKMLSDLVPTEPVVNREQEMQKPERAPEMKEGLVRGYLTSETSDDDIPF